MSTLFTIPSFSYDVYSVHYPFLFAWCLSVHYPFLLAWCLLCSLSFNSLLHDVYLLTITFLTMSTQLTIHSFLPDLSFHQAFLLAYWLFCSLSITFHDVFSTSFHFMHDVSMFAIHSLLHDVYYVHNLFPFSWCISANCHFSLCLFCSLRYFIMSILSKATAGYFYDPFAYEICFYGIVFLIVLM
jgi:hypothetical protein